MKIAAQPAGDIGPLDQNLQSLDQSGLLNDGWLQTESRTACLRESELCQVGGPLHVTEETVTPCFKHLPGSTQLQRDSGKKLGERVMNLAGQFISLREHGGLAGGF